MARQSAQRHYWDVLEPHYDAFDLYGAADDVVAALAALPPDVAQLLAAHWCQSEVTNGGFHQFFANATGVLAPEAKTAFRAIGLDAWAETLAAAMAHFGAAYPRDRHVRAALLPDRGDTFDGHDRAFYAVLKVDDEVWDNLATAFAYRSARAATSPAPRAAADAPPTLATRKPVETLAVVDLETFPVWTYAIDEEATDDDDDRDETWVKPMDVVAIPDGALSLCVAAAARLPCGLVYPAVLFSDAFRGFAVGAVALLTTEGRVLFDNSDTPRERARTLKRLGLRAADVLPLEYVTRIALAATGAPARGTFAGIDDQ